MDSQFKDHINLSNFHPTSLLAALSQKTVFRAT